MKACTFTQPAFGRWIGQPPRLGYLTAMYRTAISFMAVAALSAALPTLGAAEQPRTFIDAFAFDASSQAVEQFISSYRDADYFAVWFTLSADAKMGFGESWTRSFSARGLFPRLEEDMIPGRYFAPSAGNPDWDGLGFVMGRLFDDMMFGAGQMGVLPAAFDAMAEITSMVEREGSAMAVVRTGAAPDVVMFDLVRQENGTTWRMDRLRWDGSSNVLRPWGFD